MIRGLISYAVALLFLLPAFASQAQAEKRVALVIGNSAYEHVPELANPKNDAAAMSAKLESLGFEVTEGQDLTLNEMRRTVRRFIQSLDGADMALFFYAGHGLQVNGENYLAPTDAQLSSHLDLDFEALPINLIMSAMEQTTKVNLVFLDACRDNPLAENLARSMGTRSGAVGRGLAKLGSGVGSLIAFATQPGNVALDGEGANSPFTTALLKHLGTPGQDITRDLIYVRRDVLESTGGKQVPWDNSSLTGEVVLQPNQAKPAEPVKPDNSVEITFWNSIKDAGSRAYHEAYLQRWPEGEFALIARLKLEELDRAADSEKKAIEVARAEQDRKAAEAAELAEKQRLAEEQAAAASQKVAQQRAAELAAAREAREAAEAAQAAIEARLAELETLQQQREADEAARKSALDTSRKAEPQERVAALAQPDMVAERAQEEPQIDPAKDKALVRSIQGELNRIGCDAGTADGIWGNGSRGALRNYGKHSGVELASLEPSSRLLDSLKAVPARICPLVCRSGFEKQGDRCVAIRQEAKAEEPVARTAPQAAEPKAVFGSPPTSTPKKKQASARKCYLCQPAWHGRAAEKRCFTDADYSRWVNPSNYSWCKAL